MLREPGPGGRSHKTQLSYVRWEDVLSKCLAKNTVFPFELFRSFTATLDQFLGSIDASPFAVLPIDFLLTEEEHFIPRRATYYMWFLQLFNDKTKKDRSLCTHLPVYIWPIHSKGETITKVVVEIKTC